MRLEINIPEHQYHTIMVFDSVYLGRVPYKGIIMYAINAIKHGRVLDQEPTTKNDLGVDCISRAEVIEEINSVANDAWDEEQMRVDLIAEINALPSVTPQEPRKGHWIERHDDWGNGIITDRKYKCSVCHGKHIDPETGEWQEVFDYKYPFCPCCGADMREVEE